MKKYIWIFMIPALVLMAASCKKSKEDNSHRQFPAPEWKLDATGAYPYSMTAVIAVPGTIKSTPGSSDMLGAFVGAECRGIGTQLMVNGKPLYYVMIHGTASEQPKLQFRFYDAASKYLYASEASFDFSVDASLGSPDDPLSPAFKHMD